MATTEEIEYRCKSWRTWLFGCTDCADYKFADTEGDAKKLAEELARDGWGILGEEELLCPKCLAMRGLKIQYETAGG